MRKLKDPAIKSDRSRNEIMLKSSSIHYTCPKCKVLFNGIPKNECEFCDNKFNLRTKHEINGSTPQAHPFADQDYGVWSETDGDIRRVW